MKKWIVFFAFLIVSGCGTSFEIVKTSDKFDAPGTEAWRGRGNRITSKSTLGGWHIVGFMGIFLNPYLFIDHNTKRASVSFLLNHYSYPDCAFGYLQEAIILINNNNRIVLKFKNYEYDHDIGTWNTVTKEYNSTITETCFADIAISDFLKVCNAQELSIKIVGNDRVFIVENDDLESNFISNLKEFSEKIPAQNTDTPLKKNPEETAAPLTQEEIINKKLEQPITINLKKDAKGKSPTIEFAIYKICSDLGIKYLVKESRQKAPAVRTEIKQVVANNKKASDVINELLTPHKLWFVVNSEGVEIRK